VVGASRVLVVMRHAKAEPYADDDRDRRLTARGRTDASAAGRQLAAWGVTPDHVLVSAAERTVETWSLVKDELGASPVEEFTDELYAASAETALEALQLVPDQHRTVLLVGHNPCVAYLATVLHDGNGHPEALRRMLAGFPPAAAAVLELEDGWEALGEGTTRLTRFHTP
jgi:phosphohistidine phosphatase